MFMGAYMHPLTFLGSNIKVWDFGNFPVAIFQDKYFLVCIQEKIFLYLQFSFY